MAALGMQAWRYSHDWRDSVSLWSVALERDPENAQAWYNRGQARLDLGDKQGAFDDLTRSIEFNPRNASAFINRGVARMERDPDGAFADFNEAVRLRPTSADALVNRGWVRLARKDTEAALADLGEAIKIDPVHYQARLRRAIVLLQRGDSAAARADLNEAIRLRPLEPDAWYVRGQAHDEEQKWDAAIADYARALNVGGAGWDSRKRQRAEELLARARQRKAGR